MITPIKTMTINQIAERKDDLLMSADDIDGIVKHVRIKAIDEFAERIALEISESIIWGMLPTDCKYGVSDEIVDYVIDTSKKIAEQMKAGGIDG